MQNIYINTCNYMLYILYIYIFVSHIYETQSVLTISINFFFLQYILLFFLLLCFNNYIVGGNSNISKIEQSFKMSKILLAPDLFKFLKFLHFKKFLQSYLVSSSQKLLKHVNIENARRRTSKFRVTKPDAWLRA